MSEVLDRDSSVPLYRQLEDILHARIASGEWAPDQRIPSENELNRMFGLSRMTVRAVLSKLAADGVLVRVAGKGTYIAPAKITAVSPAYRGVREQLETLGYDITTTLLSLERTVPSTTVGRLLALAPTDEVYAIARLRRADGRPISIHRSFVPAALAPGLDTKDVVNEQLCRILDQHYDLPMRHVREHLEAVGAGGADATLLRVDRGDPLLRLTDLISASEGVPFEYSTIVFRGDAMRLTFDYDL